MSNKSAKPVSGATSATSRREQLRLQQEAEARQKRMVRIAAVGAAILALLIIAVVSVVVVQNHRNKVNEVTAQGTPVNANSDKSGIIVNPGKAKQGAPVVALYLDYQCPICKVLEGNIGGNLESLAYKGDIQLEYHTMKFMDANLLNTASTRAAVAAACSDNQGVYAKFHDAIYANQAAQEVKGSEGYSDKLLKETIPASVGLSGDKLSNFRACYDNQATLDFVKGTDDKAGASGVTGTPTIKVNGTVVEWSDPATGRPLPWASAGATDKAVLAGLTGAA